MPNISFDIFFDQDFINVTATRNKVAPRAKPEWKVRTAPKLPPKEQPVDNSGSARPPARPKLNEGRGVVGKPAQKEPADTASQAGDQARRKPPKLGARKISDALAPTVSNAVSSAGGFAGGAVNAVGNSINSVGAGVNQTVKTYGDGVKDYGNSIMDWTSATGGRGTTASNPLGLTSGTAGGKRAVTSPQVYYPPRQSPSKTLMTTDKTAGPQKKALPAPGSRSAPSKQAPAAQKAKSTAPAKAPAGKSSSAPNPGAMRRAPGQSQKPAQKAASSTAKKPAAAPAKAPAPVNKPAAANYASSKAASNPIGITW